MIKKFKNIWTQLIKSVRENELFANTTKEEKNLIINIRKRKLTYLSENKLVSLVNTCKEIKEKEVPGIFIEAGCALGGSTILITKLKDPKRSLLVYDVFGMIPPPTSEDTEDVHERYKIISEGNSKGIGGDKYYGYENNLYEMVQSNLKEFGINAELESVHLIKGLLQEKMRIDQLVAFAHIDVDWYDPVKTSLERIYPMLAIGGSIILDDYKDWGGCRKATDEFLASVNGKYKADDSYGSMKITKIL